MHKMFVFLAGIVAALPALAHGVKSGTIEIIHPWTHGAATAGADIDVSATIRNTGRRADRLVRIDAPLAVRALLVGPAATSGTTVPLSTLVIPPGASVDLKSSGPHIALRSVAKAHIPYETFPVTLEFARAGRIVIDVLVEEH